MSTAVRVLFVSHTDTASGAERVLLSLAALAIAAGHNVVVACPTGDLSAALPAGARHFPLPKLGLSGPTGWRRYVAMVGLLVRYLRAAASLRPFTRDPRTRIVVNSLFALPALRLTLRRRCCTWLVHDTLTMRKQQVILRFSAPAIRRAVAVSRSTAAPLADFDFPVVVAYNGVPTRPVPVRVDHPGRPVVGVLAKLTPWKGHLVALEALKLVPDADLEFAGDHFPGEDDYVDELRRVANEPELSGRVRFLGHCDPDDCLDRWTALISPSVAPEAGPLGILEAMAAGRPVIATDHGGSAEYLAGGAGILVPPADPDALADAVRTAIGDDQLRRSLADAGRRRVTELHDIAVTLPHTLNQLLDA